jgi:hypothetical protein
MYQQIVEQIKQDEFAICADHIRQVDYSTQRMVNTLYEYKHEDHLDNIDIANDCRKEYNKLKFVQLGHGYRPRKRQN